MKIKADDHNVHAAMAPAVIFALSRRVGVSALLLTFAPRFATCWGHPAGILYPDFPD